MNYPKRGQMSEDGKVYTHTNGSVHKRFFELSACDKCSLQKDACGEAECISGHFEKIEGAYVPTDEEREACDMAHKAIGVCSCRTVTGCEYPSELTCHSLIGKECVLRKYLADHGDAKAWEAKT
jgi:hypothetical protein